LAGNAVLLIKLSGSRVDFSNFKTLELDLMLIYAYAVLSLLIVKKAELNANLKIFEVLKAPIILKNCATSDTFMIYFDHYVSSYHWAFMKGKFKRFCLMFLCVEFF
jgi:hypothetical protein